MKNKKKKGLYQSDYNLNFNSALPILMTRTEKASPSTLIHTLKISLFHLVHGKGTVPEVYLLITHTLFFPLKAGLILHCSLLYP